MMLRSAFPITLLSSFFFFCFCWAEVPQYILESGLFPGQIAVTQPRRVAATSLAARVSAEQGRPLGSLVGYSVRFDERASPNTRIKYVTDGMLVREMMGDPLLEQYSVIIVDEAHERTLRTDLILASLKKVLKARNGDSQDAKGKAKAKVDPLKVVIMSATLDAKKFSMFFNEYVVLGVRHLALQSSKFPILARMCYMSRVASILSPSIILPRVRRITLKPHYGRSSRYT